MRPTEANDPERLIEAIRSVCEPIESLEAPDLDPLLDRIGDSRVVLLGESTHGTKEFYDLRAEITLRLIEEKGFGLIGLEADWPDVEGINRYIYGRESSWEGFHRFPEWMWRNESVVRFADRLKAYNASEGHAPVSIFGVDLYSLHSSLQAVLELLDRRYPELASKAREVANCFLPWQHDPSSYGLAVWREMTDGCRDEVTELLTRMQQQMLDEASSKDPALFSAFRNAQVIKGAEGYYRSMYGGRVESWNLRDSHMFETIEALLDHHGPDSKIVVWEHNSHLGNAAATEMGWTGEHNVGQLCKERFRDECYNIGFMSDHGTVAAASSWGGEVEFKRLRPARPDSYEWLFHETGMSKFFLPLRTAEPGLRAELRRPRLERAVGVLYLPMSERSSHYFEARLADQFDEICWIDETSAVEPLPLVPEEEEPDTYPFGL